VGVVTDMGQVATSPSCIVRDEDALANVVRSQVDVILSEGAAVLNAADPQVVKLAELSDGGVIFYALDEHNPVMEAAPRAGGERVAFLRDQHIVLARALKTAAAGPGQAEAGHRKHPPACWPRSRLLGPPPDLRRLRASTCRPI
jgi:cyanophycin synthetase